MPMGVTDEVLDLIRSNANKHADPDEPKEVYFATHVNHYHEITPEFFRAIRKIKSYGFTVRNQTVLMKHVNDDFRTMGLTLKRLLRTGVHPSYLFQCHKENGIIHYISPIEVGQNIIKNLQGWIHGTSIPKYASNISGGVGKILLMPSGIKQEEKEYNPYVTVRTYKGDIVENYCPMGECSQKIYDNAIRTMDDFIGQPGVFKPSVVLNGKDVTHFDIPQYTNPQKAKLLGYEPFKDGMPITNPADYKTD